MLINFSGHQDKPTPRMIEYALYLGIRGGAVAAMTFDECMEVIDKTRKDLIATGFDVDLLQRSFKDA